MGSSCLLMEWIVDPTQGKTDFKSKQIKCTHVLLSDSIFNNERAEITKPASHTL